ncbi:MAG: hypothetical protein ACREAB_00795 [Blastocatellia bacterium]
MNELPEAEAEVWLDLIELTGMVMPEAFGLADHYLYIGAKAPRPEESEYFLGG